MNTGNSSGYQRVTGEMGGGRENGVKYMVTGGEHTMQHIDNAL